MKRLLLCGIAAGSLSILASAANASIVYSYTTDLPANYVGQPNSQVVFHVYVTETLSGTSTSLIVADDGLNGAGAAIVRTGGGTVITSQALNTTDFNGGAALTTKHLTPSGLDFTENVSLAASDGVQGAGIATGRQELLDTVTLTLPSANGDTSTFKLGKNPAGNGSTVSYANTFNLDADGATTDPQYGGTALDGNVYSWKGAGDVTTTFTVSTTPSPEPASVGLMGIGGLLALRRRRRA